MPSLSHAAATMTKKEVIEYLGKSARTIETLVRAGRLPVKYFNGSNGKQASFERADVDRLKADIAVPMVRATASYAPAPAVAPVVSPAVSNDTGLVPFGSDAPAAVALAQSIAVALRDGLRGESPRGDEPKPWLTLDEAAAWSGLPKSWLLAQARADSLMSSVVIINVGTRERPRWRFNREALKKC